MVSEAKGRTTDRAGFSPLTFNKPAGLSPLPFRQTSGLKPFYRGGPCFAPACRNTSPIAGLHTFQVWPPWRTST
jgi:hypothetical protein